MKLHHCFATTVAWLLLIHAQSCSTQRPCRNANASFIEESVENVTTNYFTEVFEGVVNLFVAVTWTIKKFDNFELDGLLVRLRKSENIFGTNVIFAFGICHLGKDFYVRATDLSVCKQLSGCNSSAFADDGNCICDYDNCSVIPNLSCRGLRSSIDLNYSSIPGNSERILYKIDFHQEYRMEIQGYYRNVATQLENINIENPSDCLSLVETNNNKTNSEAAEICCESGIIHTTARNITFEVGYPNLNENTINGTVFWLPPLTIGNLVEMTFSIYLIDFATEASVPTSDTPVRYSFNTSDSTNKQCNVDMYGYRVNVFSLTPGLGYRLQVLARYNETDCPTTNCRQTEDIFPEIDSCDPKFEICDFNAQCARENNTISSSLNVTCLCNPGYEGNGYRNSSAILGNGCKDINACFNDEISCHANAYCVDKEAPMVGYTCRCLDGYYGDGLDCRSTLILGLTIALPIFAVLLGVVAIVIWKYRIYVIRKNELTWSKFVANKDIVLQNFLEDYDKQIENVPSFGDRWELDRSSIILNGVIGRGNFGIVRKGIYSFEKTSKLVAIKQLKDGLDSGQELVNFMGEISFMLNTGVHPNILGVIGCCTTEKPVLLVTEYLAYGDLKNFLIESRELSKRQLDPIYCVTEKSLCQMARQVAVGMEYLTKTRIIHGDLAARNILVGEDLICKISDFGLANDVYRYGVIQSRTERLVPFKWISPERMMEGKVPITSKSDVWSFGNLMYEMFTLGCMPHPGILDDNLLEKLEGGYRMEQPSTCSNQLYSVMSNCWKWKDWTRPSFTEIIKLLENAEKHSKDDCYIEFVEANGSTRL